MQKKKLAIRNRCSKFANLIQKNSKRVTNKEKNPKDLKIIDRQ